jgi:glycosyltransferase involved in cell wall biosynthesis
MKYPFVIIYRKDNFSHIDHFFIENANKLDCSIFIADSIDYVKNLHNSNFHFLITYGDSYEHEHELLTIISKNMMNRHIHITPDSPNILNVNNFNVFVNDFYINLCTLERNKVRPTFSLFTPSFNSYKKILRVYNSLKKQTLLDWEWIIMDDSPDDKHFSFLREHFSEDQRIRFYRKSCNNGSIGNVKNETIGLCRGKYLLEMDHDDELMPYVLQESADLFDSKPDIGFIYFDCACVYENGENQWYGNFICKGYGGYYSQKYDGHWRLIYITPNINNITMSHLVCCPNHPRIWRRETLLDMGSYCEYLPICDDYEIILRTSIYTNIAKIHKLGYIQYMNDSNNNFSLIRNSEINRIGPHFISPIYYDKFNINEKMKYKDAYEDEKYINQHSKIWERDPSTYQHKYCNIIVNNDYDKQFCIIGFDSLLANIDRITELYKNPRNDFIILENKCPIEYLQQRIERYNFERMKCYTLIDTPNEQLTNYFKLLYLSVPDYEIIYCNIEKPKYNTNAVKRSQIINQLTNKNDKYLEIGVEYGECFNEVHFTHKVGVDPDPKFTPINGELFKLTSDDYFTKYNIGDTSSVDSDDIIEELPVPVFDVIFIDGMHQAEYVLKDINNSLHVLSDNGVIFIDDILPFNYNEQLKIPIKHYYENGILKYGENWTGDVWKVIYHILKNYNNHIKIFKYYYNIDFRGIGMFKFKEKFQINYDDIDIINNYSYFNDFTDYLLLLQQSQ